MSPWSERDHRLTGRFRVRQGFESEGFFGSAPVLIAQVEERYTYYPVIGPDSDAQDKLRWRDMRASDMPVPGLRND